MNPLNTYLSTKPSFASPEPLAAASGLTIPIKITLSEIRLSAFIILVFSKQKGLTLVFRNDPLESLKVSSTFDSIPFIQSYLQKEIEVQLRTLLMDEVPAIIHRLSLRLWVSEYRAHEDQEQTRPACTTNKQVPEEVAQDPFASPPQDPVDFSGQALDAAQIAALSLDSSAETHSLFAQKNLLRLAALTSSHRTLSLFEPSMRDVVFRAWAGPIERGEATETGTANIPPHPFLSRKHAHGPSTSTAYTFSDGSEGGRSVPRPSLTSYPTASSLSVNKYGRKRKHRVVNLRKKKTLVGDEDSVSGESSRSATVSSTMSEYSFSHPSPIEREGELITPPSSPARTRHQGSPDSIDLGGSPPPVIDPMPNYAQRVSYTARDKSDEGSSLRTNQTGQEAASTIRASKWPQLRPSPSFQSSERYASGKIDAGPPFPTDHAPAPFTGPLFPHIDYQPGGILEQTWMMKIAREIACRVEDEKRARSGFWEGGEREEMPPPAYGL